jgi:tetratricopeptide (TPR) repeat protein
VGAGYIPAAVPYRISLSVLVLVLRASLLLGWSLGAAQAQSAPARIDGLEAEGSARVAFEAGRAAYEAGQFDVALREFRRAYALSPHAEMLFNIGRSAEADGELEAGIEAYTAFLDAIPFAENRAFVEGRLGKLRAAQQARREQEARAALPAVTLPASERQDAPDPPPLRKRPWFWVGVGGVVVAVVVTSVALSVDREPPRARADERVMTLVQR